MPWLHYGDHMGPSPSFCFTAFVAWSAHADNLFTCKDLL